MYIYIYRQNLCTFSRSIVYHCLRRSFPNSETKTLRMQFSPTFEGSSTMSAKSSMAWLHQGLALPETINSEWNHLKMDGWKMNIPFWNGLRSVFLQGSVLVVIFVNKVIMEQKWTKIQRRIRKKNTERPCIQYTTLDLGWIYASIHQK